MYHGKRKMGRWSETMVGFMMACIGCCGFCGLLSSIGCDPEVCGSWPIVLCSGYLLLRLGFSLTEMTSPKSWLIARREQPIVLEKALLWNRSNQCPHCVVCHWLVSVSPVGGQPESWSITALDLKRASWNLCKLSSTSLLISYLFNVPHTLDSIVVAWSGGGAVSEIVYIKSQFSFFLPSFSSNISFCSPLSRNKALRSVVTSDHCLVAISALRNLLKFLATHAKLCLL